MAIDSPNVAAQLEQRVAELVRLLRTHARRRLVEQQHVGIGGQHGGDLDPLQRAVRQAGDLGVEQVAEAEGLGQRVGPGPQLALGRHGRAACRACPTIGRVVGLQVLRGDQVVADRRALDQPDVLERPPEAEGGPLVDRHVGDVRAPCSSTRPGVGRVEAGDQVEQRRLAGAVRPDDADDLVLADRHAHVAVGLDAAEADREVVRLKHGHR